VSGYATIDAIYRAGQLAAWRDITEGICPASFVRPEGRHGLVPAIDPETGDLSGQCPITGRYYRAWLDPNGDRVWSANGDEVVIPAEAENA